MGNTLNPVAKKQIVWLDVVRLLAMFMVVCCHSTDPFNFIRANRLPISVRSSSGELLTDLFFVRVFRFCNDYGSFAVAGQR